MLSVRFRLMKQTGEQNALPARVRAKAPERKKEQTIPSPSEKGPKGIAR
jgi:hypothetical protein